MSIEHRAREISRGHHFATRYETEPMNRDSYNQRGQYQLQRQMSLDDMLLENRIVKNGELRYFDHPKFGVIAKITRVDEAEADEEFEDDEDNSESRSDSRRLMSRIDRSVSQ